MNFSFDKYDPKLQELLLKCQKSTKVFAKTFFPEEVTSEFSLLHDKMFAVMDHPSKRKKALAAPRGLGKTTLAKIRCVKAIVFRERRFITYISNSSGSAIESTEHIKRLMIENEYLNRIFGKVSFSQKGFKEGFSKESWVAYGDVYVLPRGAGQQVRGKNWMGHRPGLFIIDDLENTDNVRSDEQREKLSNWFFSDVMQSESKFGERDGIHKGQRAECIYIDTIKHQDSLLQLLIDSSDWLDVSAFPNLYPDTPDGVLSICDESFNTYDPNYMTTEEIKEEYAEHTEKGKQDLFYMEFMNIPISLKDAVFKPESFKYYEEAGDHLIVQNHPLVVQRLNKMGHNLREKERISIRELVTLVIVDPARTINLSSAESAVIVVSIHRKSRKIFVRDPWGKKVKPDALYDQMFMQCLMYNARYLAVEVTGLHEFISQPIKNEIRIRKISSEYVELNARGDKDLRISNALSNYYAQGQIYHNASNSTALENQLKWHPKSKRKDLIDALSYITKLINEFFLFFDAEEDDFDEENEYADIDLEDKFEDEYENEELLLGDGSII